MILQEKCVRIAELLNLHSEPLGFKLFSKEDDVRNVKGVTMMKDSFYTFCQMPYLAKVDGLTVGSVASDKMLDRCKKSHGLQERTEAEIEKESRMLATTWMPDVESAARQLRSYPVMPLSAGLVLGPLSKATYDPDIVILYPTPGQMVLLLQAMQKIKYENYAFNFCGEGSCVNSIAQCYASNKPAMTIPCAAEVAFSDLPDDELTIALPLEYVDLAVQGLEIFFKYMNMKHPLPKMKGSEDNYPFMKGLYPDFIK